MKTPSILYLAINLETSVERRKSVLNQGRKLGLDIHLVRAVSGKELKQDDLEGYDRRRRHKEFVSDLTLNEHACIYSHCKALRLFLESDDDFCVVFEDDVLIRDFFSEGIQYLVTETSGWECCKLYTDHSKLYSLPPYSKSAPFRLVFPKKLPWVAVANLYTRKGARYILEGFQRYWLGFDVQWAQILLSRQVPVCGVSPGLAVSADPDNTNSDIDRGMPRCSLLEGKRRSLFQYGFYRLSVWSMAFGKFFMRLKLCKMYSNIGKNIFPK